MNHLVPSVRDRDRMRRRVRDCQDREPGRDPRPPDRRPTARPRPTYQRQIPQSREESFLNNQSGAHAHARQPLGHGTFEGRSRWDREISDIVERLNELEIRSCPPAFSAQRDLPRMVRPPRRESPSPSPLPSPPSRSGSQIGSQVPRRSQSPVSSQGSHEGSQVSRASSPISSQGSQHGDSVTDSGSSSPVSSQTSHSETPDSRSLSPVSSQESEGSHCSQNWADYSDWEDLS